MRWVVLACVLAGCYHPAGETACTISCADSPCPASLECGGDGMCHAQGAGDCVPDAAIPDAPADVATDAPADAASAPTLVQFATMTSTSIVHSQSVTLKADTTTGDVLVMVGANDSDILISVTGGGVADADWTRATRADNCANTEIWYGVVTAGGTLASETVTITAENTSTGDSWLWVSEWSGLDTQSLLDQATGRGTTTANGNATPGSITTTAARELVILSASAQLGALSFGTPTPGTWKAMPTTGTMYKQGEWTMTTSAQLVSFGPSVGPATSCWDSAIATFRVQ